MSTAFSHFNMSHWLRVKAARTACGLQNACQDIETSPHPLTGAKLVDKSTGETVLVEYVRKEWHLGNFSMAKLTKADGNYEMLAIDKGTSASPDVARQVERFNATFERQPH